MKNVSRGRETGGHFVLHFGSSLVSLLSLGVNLLGHNGNSQDGRMKVLIPSILTSSITPSVPPSSAVGGALRAVMRGGTGGNGRMGEGQLEEDFIVLVPWIVRRSFTPGSYYPSVARRAPHVRGELEQEPEAYGHSSTLPYPCRSLRLPSTRPTAARRRG